jgi:ion channel-forming bestrophin family protein
MPDSVTLLSKLRSSTLLYVGALAVLAGLYASLPVCKEYSNWKELWDIPSNFHASLSLVLGCLLVFRTNTAYSRWWEARTLWGGLVNASRNLAAKLGQLVTLPADELAAAQRDIVAFCHALKDHLRDGATSKKLPGFDGEILRAHHLPAHLISRRYAALREWKKAGHIDGDELRVIDAELAKFLEICGGCERIRNTRVVRSFRYFARQSVLVFIITFPWALVHDFGWWTIPVSMIAAYFMLGLEVVAEHIEEPFGYDEDDLDLDRICESIERSVKEIIAPNEELESNSADVVARSI